jgi:hypothetical protein
MKTSKDGVNSSSKPIKTVINHSEWEDYDETEAYVRELQPLVEVLQKKAKELNIPMIINSFISRNGDDLRMAGAMSMSDPKRISAVFLAVYETCTGKRIHVELTEPEQEEED